MSDKINPYSKTNEDKKPDQQVRVEFTKDAKEPRTQKIAVVTKGKQGRPCIDETKGKKRDYCKTINIAVPKDTLDLVNKYALVGRGLNLTEYVNVLITKDLEKNLENYKEQIKRSVKFD